jgi:transcription elongation factor Elf1
MNWKCGECGKVFDEKLKKKKFTLKISYLMAGVRPSVCPFCGSKNISPSMGFLIQFQCPKCGENQSHRISDDIQTENAWVSCKKCGANSELEVSKASNDEIDGIVDNMLQNRQGNPMDKISKTNSKNVDDEISSYLKSLLEKKGMGILPQEILDNMLVDLYSRFNNFLFLNIMKKIPKEKYKEFDHFRETQPTPKQSMDFMKNNVTNLNKFVEESFLDFEKIFLS